MNYSCGVGLFGCLFLFGSREFIWLVSLLLPSLLWFIAVQIHGSHYAALQKNWPFPEVFCVLPQNCSHLPITDFHSKPFDIPHLLEIP